ILEHYRKLGLVTDIEGNQEITEVFADVEKALLELK
ncbi:TPA: adenylate kinase, partial [Streptococcus agalactiae]